MNRETFESLLTGGHPNSLGRTEEVVALVLADRSRLEELYGCYRSDDEVVRLRVSGALKRVSLARPEWLIPFVDRLLTEISELDQPSAQWTLALLMNNLKALLTEEQTERAVAVMRRNLEHPDWIVLNNPMQVLAEWSADHPDIREWLRPHLERLTGESRRSVAGRARKLLTKLYDS